MTTTQTQNDGPASAAGGPERLAATARDLAATATETVKQEAATFADKAKDTVGEQAGKAQTAASQTLGDFASAVRKAGDELAQSDQSMAGRLVQQAANGLEQVSRSLADKQPGELIDTVRDFGRSNPVAFIGGAVLLGIALGRFARTSAPNTGSTTSNAQPGRSDTSAGAWSADRPTFEAPSGAGQTSGAGQATSGSATSSPAA